MFEKIVRRVAVSFVLICVCLLITMVEATAQTSGGGIRGTVNDPAGAVVPGATVTAKNVATGIETKRQTTDSGLYVISPLPPGQYQVTVAVSGFQTLIQEGVVVDAVGTTSVDLTLKAGNIDETVTVSDAPAQLNETDPRLGQTIRNEIYSNLPLSMGTAVAGAGIGQGPRNPGAFIYLLPGVTEGNGTRWGNINGGQGFSKDVFIEGVPITDPIQQGEGRTISLSVSVEAVEQFQVETSGTGVEFNGQGSENYTIKSGKNQFHATGFEYLRNTSLNARGFFPVVRPIEHQNEFGFTVGGPIIKKKLFFFTSYDGWRYRVVSPSLTGTVPTLAMRTGDFFGVANIYDPLSTICNGNVCTRTQFSDPSRASAANPTGINIIPANRISAISKVYQQPLPNPTNSGILNNFLGQVPVQYNNDSFNLKIDYDLTTNQRISALYTYGKRSQPGPYREIGDASTILPLPYTQTRIVEEIPTVLQFKHAWSISPNLINTASFGYQRLFIPITNATSADKWAAKSGLQGLPPGDASDAFLEANFGTVNNAPTSWRGTNSRDFEDDNHNYTFQDTVLYVRGNHSFKFGGQFQRTLDFVKIDDTGTFFNATFSNNQTGNFGTGSASNSIVAATGNSYASFLLGAVSSATINDNTVSGVEPTVPTFTTYSWWVADDWKVTKRLTINLGLRHDIMIPYLERNDKFTFLDPNAPNSAAGGIKGALRFGGNYAPAAISCNCRQIINTDYGALGPRVGFAFAIDDKTVLRAGYGIMYTRRGAVGGRENARTGTGFVGLNASPPLTSLTSYDPAFYWQNGIPAYTRGPIYSDTYLTGFNGTGAGGTLTYGNPDSVPPRYTNWNISIQRSITNSMVLTAAYVGGIGKSLAGAAPGKWTNQTDPKYLVLGNLLNSNATPANLAAAALIVPGIALPFPTFVGTIGQMLKPFPQYVGVAAPYNNDGQSNYQAMQLSVQQRLTRGLTFNVNYTYSRSKGTVNGFQSAYIGIVARSRDDQPHVLNGFYSYELPFGKGRAIDPDNSVIRAIISGWQISGITRFASGVPLGPFTVTCSSGQQGTCYANLNPNYTGNGRINGAWGSGNNTGASAGTTRYIDATAFVAPTPHTYGNSSPTGPYGLRQPHFFNQDFGITRNFQITENARFVFGLDAQNLFNNVRFGGISTALNGFDASGQSTNGAFGKVTSQINLPRAFQFKFRIEI